MSHLLIFGFSLRDAASKAIAEGDPWAKHHMEKIPAERIIRHMYHPESKTWSEDETIVKMEKEPFTHGAMRFCYRMKKRSTPPQSASNHRFHNYGWTRASNYVAKAYQRDGEVDCSEEAKAAVKNDIMLQYEASHWAELFNDIGQPPKKIVFIRAYAIEFPDREGQPWFAVERFIAGNDSYGAGFTKHNTNSGFVDEDLHRVTPQVFSAHSFYCSDGNRLVADIQGVGDLFTDPQVLSSDYRFGDGDLGPRGMALFFKSFRHNSLADAMGIPVFQLSKNELKVQAKYDEDEYSMSGENSDLGRELDKFAALDLNRNRRQSMLLPPPKAVVPEELQATEKRSNLKKESRDDVRKSLRDIFAAGPAMMSSSTKANFHRTKSDVSEVQLCMEIAKSDLIFDKKTMFHRKSSGEMLRPLPKQNKRGSLLIRKVSNVMEPSTECRANLGKVHYQLAVLHGMGRFPDVVPEPVDPDAPDDEHPHHDAFSVLFHLAHASSLNNVPALLALGRVHAGLETMVSPLLGGIAPIDFDTAKDLLRRAMESPYPPASPKAAAGCLLYQILLDEGDTSDQTIMTLLDDTINLLEESQKEEKEKEHHKKREKGTRRYIVGDRVEANYALEGTFYPGDVVEVSEDGSTVVVQYDDDGSTESLTLENVKLIVPPNATQTNLGGPLSDEEALGVENSDENCLMEAYELKAELAEYKSKVGDNTTASRLYEEAADSAMTAGKMKKATEWSLKASELAA